MKWSEAQRHYRNLSPDTEVFILLENDKLAPRTILFWCTEAAQLSGDTSAHTIRKACECALRMRPKAKVHPK